MAENIDNLHHGGYDVEFVTKPMINVCCPICVLTMENPVQTLPCSHQFCEDCITRHKDRFCMFSQKAGQFPLRCDCNSAGPHHRCPVCNGEIKNWFPDGVSKRMILDLLTRCPNHNEGCLDTFELRSLNEHLLICGHQKIQCTITNCESKVQRRYLVNHLAECTNRTVRCEHCNDSYIFQNKQIHEVECKRFPVQCTNNNCGDIVAREEMAMHLEDVCLKTIHDCKYLNIIGCKEQGKRKELAEHMENDIKQHLFLAIDKIEDNRDFTSRETKELKDDKEKMSREIKELKDGKEKTSREIKELKDGKEKTSHEIKKLNDDKEKLSREIQELKDLMTQKCDFLYKSTFKSTLLNRASIEIKNFDAVERQVEETGLEKDFYSDKFFCFDGYQAMLHARTRLNYSLSKRLNAVHIDAYFVLTKGPYDDDLKWPFEGNIRFSILHQGNYHPAQKKVSTSNMTPEEIEKYFKKPISVNPGYRCPLLLTVPFEVTVNHDTLKIEIDVSKQYTVTGKNM